MADLTFSLSQCADHCLHTGGLAPAGAGHCCFCGYMFGIPAATSTASGVHQLRIGKGQLGPFYPTIKAAGGYRDK